MSRIIIKNLPSKAEESQIRKHFESNGTITDVKLMRKKSGESRHFAFVGFKTNEQALNAVKFFDGTFMNTSKLEVDLAKSIHDDSLLSQAERRKRKRLATQIDESQAKGRFKKPTQATNKDTQLDDFLNAMKPQSQKPLWENQHGTAPQANEDLSSDEEVDDLLIKPRVESEAENCDISTQNNTKTLSENQVEPDSDKPDVDPESEVTIQSRAAMSDLEWLKQKRTRLNEGTSSFIPKTDAPIPPAPQIEKEVDVNQELILSSGRLFIRNLSYQVTQDDLSSLFEPFGKLSSVVLPLDSRTEKLKGFAYVKFIDEKDALHAYESLDGSHFQGRILHILGAKPKIERGLDEFDLKNLPLKKQRQLKQKRTASDSQFSWNSLFLNQDTVLETVAAKLGVSKSDMLDPHSSNASVQKALAESSVLQSVQEYFKSNGVDLSKFTTKETDDKVILIKNLPFGTSRDEISDLFGTHGAVVRVLMPPDGGMAIVEMDTMSAGRTAFSKLAFRRIGNSILYLQKAPKGILKDAGIASEKPDAEPVHDTKSAGELILEGTSNEEALEEEAHQILENASLFVKNLSFVTANSQLTELFRPLEGFISTEIKTKQNLSGGKPQSMGFGFVTFKSVDNARVALQAMQDHVLDGHKLQLKISTRGGTEGLRDNVSGKDQAVPSTKIVIKNVPFETTKNDLLELFGTFGKLRSIRLPRKSNKQSRGFAFAEFVSLKEAKHAMDSLRGAHLLGRRLVMDFAESDAVDAEEEISRMEAKVRTQVDAEQVAKLRVHGQRKGFEIEDNDNSLID